MGSRDWVRSQAEEEGGLALPLRVKLKVAEAWFQCFPAPARQGPQRRHCGFNPSLLAAARVSEGYCALVDPWHSGNASGACSSVEWGNN